MRTKIVCALLLLSFVITLISPVLATQQTPPLQKVYSMLEDKPSAKPGKPGSTTTSVNIRNIANGDIVYSEVLIIAQVTGTFDSVVYQIDEDEEISMTRVSSSDRYEAKWAITQSAGQHTLTVKARNGDTVVASSSVTVNVVDDYQWEVHYEIDFMVGHEPPTSVLTYMMNYWMGHAVKITYTTSPLPEDVDPTPTDGYISQSDFWAIERKYNDGIDNSQNGYLYNSKQKWMLYGTWDTNSNVGGYTYVAYLGRDLAAGNYIFIADSMIDNWETTNQIPSEGGEVIVTCHEAGHSLGIAVLKGLSERYDSDAYSLMSYMRTQNAGTMASYWYYSKEYWTTANLSFYQYP